MKESGLSEFGKSSIRVWPKPKTSKSVRSLCLKCVAGASEGEGFGFCFVKAKEPCFSAPLSCMCRERPSVPENLQTVWAVSLVWCRNIYSFCHPSTHLLFFFSHYVRRGTKVLGTKARKYLCDSNLFCAGCSSLYTGEHNGWTLMVRKDRNCLPVIQHHQNKWFPLPRLPVHALADLCMCAHLHTCRWGPEKLCCLLFISKDWKTS